MLRLLQPTDVHLVPRQPPVSPPDIGFTIHQLALQLFRFDLGGAEFLVISRTETETIPSFLPPGVGQGHTDGVVVGGREGGGDGGLERGGGGVRDGGERRKWGREREGNGLTRHGDGRGRFVRGNKEDKEEEGV
jgi:hypothetical protein